jgi:uncharacterized protein
MLRSASLALRPPAPKYWVVGLFVLVLSLLGATVRAEPAFPSLNGTRVVDDAGILSDATEHDLDVKLKGLEDATTDQVVVVTVKDLQGYPIEDYGYQLGRHWGIGQKGEVKASNGQTYKDNGVLIIVAPNDRKARIEVGYGLEPVLPDIFVGHIIREDMLPKFKSGDYDGGVEAAADAVIKQLSLDRGVAIQKAQAMAQQPAQHQRGLPIGVIILIIIVFVMFSRGWLPWFILGNVLGGGGRGWGGGGGWSGGGGDWGGGGGGGFSGGGGSFGGGGSSGSW